MENYDHLLGKYGRLTVLQFYKNEKNRQFCVCSCDCGNVKNIDWQSVRRGITISCGCYRNEQVKKSNTTHGMTKTKEYISWMSIIQRCRNPKSVNYENYGGSGIDVCESWLSFENFIQDMGLKPTGKIEIDRIDNKKGYSKENCRWTTSQENIWNSGPNKKSTSKYKGVFYRKERNAYIATITYNGKDYYLGYFKTEKEAAIKYNEAAKKFYGEYAYLNEIL